MNDKAKIKRLQDWLLMLAVLPDDSPEGRQRDELWKSKLEDELAELQNESIRTRLNCLAHLAKARNALRGLIP